MNKMGCYSINRKIFNNVIKEINKPKEYILRFDHYKKMNEASKIFDRIICEWNKVPAAYRKNIIQDFENERYLNVYSLIIIDSLKTESLDFYNFNKYVMKNIDKIKTLKPILKGGCLSLNSVFQNVFINTFERKPIKPENYITEEELNDPNNIFGILAKEFGIYSRSGLVYHLLSSSLLFVKTKYDARILRYLCLTQKTAVPNNFNYDMICLNLYNLDYYNKCFEAVKNEKIKQHQAHNSVLFTVLKVWKDKNFFENKSKNSQVLQIILCLKKIFNNLYNRENTQNERSLFNRDNTERFLELFGKNIDDKYKHLFLQQKDDDNDIFSKIQSNDPCHICFDTNANIKTECRHLFCEDCLVSWFSHNKNSCPYCRHEFTQINMISPYKSGNYRDYDPYYIHHSWQSNQNNEDYESEEDDESEEGDMGSITYIAGDEYEPGYYSDLEGVEVFYDEVQDLYYYYN